MNINLFVKIILAGLILSSCQSTYFLEIRRTIANDPAFVNSRVVVVEVLSDPADYSQVRVDTSSSHVVSKGKLELDPKIMSFFRFG